MSDDRKKWKEFTGKTNKIVDKYNKIWNFTYRQDRNDDKYLKCFRNMEILEEKYYQVQMDFWLPIIIED